MGRKITKTQRYEVYKFYRDHSDMSCADVAAYFSENKFPLSAMSVSNINREMRDLVSAGRMAKDVLAQTTRYRGRPIDLPAGHADAEKIVLSEALMRGRQILTCLEDKNTDGYGKVVKAMIDISTQLMTLRESAMAAATSSGLLQSVDVDALDDDDLEQLAFGDD